MRGGGKTRGLVAVRFDFAASEASREVCGKSLEGWCIDAEICVTLLVVSYEFVGRRMLVLKND